MRRELCILMVLGVLAALIGSGCGPTTEPATEPPMATPAPTEAPDTSMSSTLTQVIEYESTVAASTPTPSTGTKYCTDWQTGTRMSYQEAVAIADEGKCTEDGQLKGTHMCNEFTGTWWIDLDIDRSGCSPACVIRVADKTARINWRCTGLVTTPTTKTSLPIQPTQVSTPSGDKSQKDLRFGLARVDTIDIQTLESFPVQIRVVAKGTLPDGCTKIREVVKERDNNTFSVTIRTARPTDAMCTQVLVPFEEVISLDVLGLKAGKYTVAVNGVKGSFELAQDNVLS